jgi:hypothetical protein
MFKELKITLVIILFCFTSQANDECEVKSHTISVENIENTDGFYNAYVSIATIGSCDSMECKLDVRKKEHVVIKSNQKFQDRQYHVYEFKNLTNYENYEYSCGDVKYSMKFPKESESTTIAAIGDWSECEEGKKSLDYLQNKTDKFDAVLLLGDMAYDLENTGNNFMTFIKPLTQKTPFMITSGNHENKNNYFDYIKRFHMPKKDEYENLYYSFDINNAHFVAIPSEFIIKLKDSDKSKVDSLKLWLQKDLKETKKKWKIVYLHRPVYCSDSTNIGCTDGLIRSHFEEIFFQNKVDLVLSGDIHNYERFYPIYEGIIDQEAIKDKNVYKNPKYPTYLICGATGSIKGLDKRCKECFNN